MNSLLKAAALLAAVLVTGCATDPNAVHPPSPPTPPGPPGWPGQRNILESPSGSRLRYQDNHGRYTITLFPDGRYRFVSVSQNETMADTTEGRWAWHPAGNRRGELTIGDDTWSLRFVSPERAEATTSGDARSYSFSFKPL